MSIVHYRLQANSDEAQFTPMEQNCSRVNTIGQYYNEETLQVTTEHYGTVTNHEGTLWNSTTTTKRNMKDASMNQNHSQIRD